jgi:hypothetical protein
MTRKSLGRGLRSMIPIILIPAAAASAGDGTPVSNAGSGTSAGSLMTHLGDADVLPIKSTPAPAGVSAIQPNVAQALQTRARMPRSVPVPPWQEIEILDPNVDPLGRPAVKVSPVIGPDGQAHIDIPPTILVHRFYYTGDRSFQGPMLPGGPTVVVVNHPADGERVYLEIQMLPGAPRVFYTRHSIEYNYGVQSIILSFGAHGRPKVTFRQGVSLATKARVATEQAEQATVRLIDRTGAPEAGRKVYKAAKNAVVNAADRAHDVGKAVVTPLVQIARLIPGVSMLTSSAEQGVQNERDSMVQRAEADTTRLEASIPTNR